MQNIIIIGGGILGASAAYLLSKQTVKVVLIDRKDRGQATDAAAGIICPWISQRRNKAWYALAKNGAAFYPDLISQLEADGEVDTGYAQVGAISLHQDEEKLLKMKERALKRKEDAPEMGEITQLTPEETKRRFPLLPDDMGSVHVSGAARVDGRALRDALIRGAVKHGAQHVRDSASLLFTGKKITGVQAGEKTYEAETVIICAGAWANALLEPLGMNMKVTFQKAQIAHLNISEKTKSWPVVMPPSDQYVLAFDHGKIVIGATHENDPEGYDTRITAGGLNEVFAKGIATAPGLADAEFSEARTGFRPFTPGFLPVVGPIPGWEGLLFANGLGASGLTMGPFIGKQLAMLALGQEPDLDLSPYNVQGAMEM
ncbi:NAD(P)/FAD-dependent oxidoreductase [Fictibacillus enclensis]|uniref:NAD(P)/FAD-dependent oxidoreductase n=1 Tax=Fictibacillus enclensis TaxID=1017270 RepID=UPI0024BF2A36|nr:FAD-binding oxidoreductase [Fictibacillus enclensis]WHY74771.1 FAD-binding oxidoreductase [Fictibacillus enclensis]